MWAMIAVSIAMVIWTFGLQLRQQQYIKRKGSVVEGPPLDAVEMKHSLEEGQKI
jgi:hypothetical protein